MISDALLLAAKGLAVFPCLPNGKAPATARGFRDATKDPSLICAWWNANPAFNVAVATGPPSGIFVIDVDAEAGLAQLEKRHGVLPPTVESVTPRGGRHVFFRYPPQQEIHNSVGRIAEGVDVRASGGYVLVAPSIVGRRYVWSVDSTDSFAEAPGWLLGLLATAGGNGAVPAEEWCTIIRGVTEGRRNQSATRLAGHLLRHSIDPRVVHELLQVWNAARCHPPLEESEITRVVSSICARELRRRGA
jgi:hypothetical protein